jgi:hypothetical protein
MQKLRQSTETLPEGDERRCPIPSPRNSSLLAERTIQVALGLLDERKEQPCSIVESEQTTPDEKYQALVNLAYMIGILVREAAEAEAATLHQNVL